MGASMASLKIETPISVKRRLEDFKKVLDKNNADEICDGLLALGVSDPDIEFCECKAEDLASPWRLWVHMNHRIHNASIHRLLQELPPETLIAVREAVHTRAKLGERDAQVLLTQFIPHPRSTWI